MMKLFRQVRAVHEAQAKAAAHRAELAEPAARLLARGERHPLTVLAISGGVGFVLGSLDVHPLRVPGVGPLLRGGLIEAMAQGTRVLTELGIGAVEDAGA